MSKKGTMTIKQALILCIVMLSVAGTITIGYGIYTAGYEKVEGVVTGITSKRGGKRHKKSYYEIIEYEYNGILYDTEQSILSSTSASKGDKETVKINPKKPTAVFDKRFWDMLIWVDSFSFVFVVVLVIKAKKTKNNMSYNPIDKQ